MPLFKNLFKIENINYLNKHQHISSYKILCSGISIHKLSPIKVISPTFLAQRPHHNKNVLPHISNIYSTNLQRKMIHKGMKL